MKYPFLNLTPSPTQSQKYQEPLSENKNEFQFRLDFRIKQLKELKSQTKPYSSITPNNEYDESSLKLPDLLMQRSINNPEKPPKPPQKLNQLELKQANADLVNLETIFARTTIGIASSSTKFCSSIYNSLVDKDDTGKSEKTQFDLKKKPFSTLVLQSTPRRTNHNSKANARYCEVRMATSEKLSSLASNQSTHQKPQRLPTLETMMSVNQEQDKSSPQSEMLGSENTTNLSSQAHSYLKYETTIKKSQVGNSLIQKHIRRDIRPTVFHSRQASYQSKNSPCELLVEDEDDDDNNSEAMKTIKQKQANKRGDLILISDQCQKYSHTLADKVRLMRKNEKQVIKHIKAGQFRRNHSVDSQSNLSFSDRSQSGKFDNKKLKLVQTYIQDAKSKGRACQTSLKVVSSFKGINQEDKLRSTYTLSDYNSTLKRTNKNNPNLQSIIQSRNQKNEALSRTQTAAKTKNEKGVDMNDLTSFRTKLFDSIKLKKDLKQVAAESEAPKKPSSSIFEQLKARIFSKLNKKGNDEIQEFKLESFAQEQQVSIVLPQSTKNSRNPKISNLSPLDDDIKNIIKLRQISKSPLLTKSVKV